MQWAKQPEPIKTFIGVGHKIDLPFMFDNAIEAASSSSVGYTLKTKWLRRFIAENERFARRIHVIKQTKYFWLGVGMVAN